jgi:FtsP/CotA-like multicopper oxidase with cupredoxin domain
MSRNSLLAFVSFATFALLALAGCFRDGGKSVDPDFPTDVAGLGFAKAPEVLELKDGDTLTLTSAPVKKVLKGVEVRMLGYNGSIPGPTLKVKQHSRLTLRIRNRSGLPSSLHSHGIRMDYRSDGAATTAASAIPDGGSQDYDLTFPDAGLYWYHPHFRQDYALEMGQYGNILVAPADTGYWGPVDRETLLMLDDFYLDPDRETAPFRRDAPDRNLMGRFGNLYLINGDTAFAMTVKRKERVRFLATNSCNTRVINLEFRDPAGAVSKIKIVGSDNGPYEWFDTAGSTTVAPSERKVFEAYFEKAGTYRLVNHMLRGRYTFDSTEALGSITVLADSVATGLGEGFLGMEGSSATRRSMDSVRSFVDPAVPYAKELLLTGTMRMVAPKRAAQPEPISIEAKGIEWYDHMALMNEISGPHNTTWAIRDLETGKENHDIYWSFERGTKVKIRIRNDTAATHPMPHPIHFHGQRFLIAAVNGRRNLNLAWKDTYLVGTEETVDILLDAWNPGEWMAHCHIAEHHESMMMFHFKVE